MNAGRLRKYTFVLMILSTILAWAVPVMAQGPGAPSQPTVVQQLTGLLGQMLLNLIFINGPTLAVAAYVLYRVTKRAVIAGRLAELGDLQPQRGVDEYSERKLKNLSALEGA